MTNCGSGSHVTPVTVCSISQAELDNVTVYEVVVSGMVTVKVPEAPAVMVAAD